MRVDHPFGLPAPRMLGQVLGIDLARRDHDRLQFAVDAVAIDIDVGKIEIGPERLQFAEIDQQRGRIPQPEGFKQAPVARNRLQIARSGNRHSAAFDLVERKAVAGELEMVLDIGPLAFELLRFDDDQLEQVGIEPHD